MAKSVTLVSPTGQRTTVSDPAGINNLIYGAGYRYLKDVEAEERAARERAEAEQAAQQAESQPTRQQSADRPKQS